MIRLHEKASPAKLATDWKHGKGIHVRDRVAIRRGVVEYNRDPDHRGRVKVRVTEDGPEYSQTREGMARVPTLSLAWAAPLFGFGSGAGFGAFTVPPVGSRVFVMYERANTDQAVYFGGWFANAARRRRYGVTGTTLAPPPKEYEEQGGYTEAGKPGGEFMYPPRPTQYQGHWEEEQGPEIPLELTEMIDHTPDSQMLFKTLKGASMLVKERDEAEELVLTDRLGAELRFESNTALIEDGVTRRGRVSATQHEPMSLDNLTNIRHTVALLSATRTGLEIENNTLGDNRLAIQLHPEQELKKNMELLGTRCAVELDPGEEKVNLVWVEEGVEVGHIKFDGISRRLDIKGLDYTTIVSDEDIVLSSPRIKLIGDVEIEGEVKHFGGKKMVFWDNDMEPYGSQFRNWWPYDDRLDPYTEDAAVWGEAWEATREYKR